MNDLGQLRLFSDSDAKPQHTLGHIRCPACEQRWATLNRSLSSESYFPEAADLWMESRKLKGLPGAVTARYIRKNTEDSYAQYVRSLDLFFHEMRLCDIKPYHLGSYQVARLAGAYPFIRKRRPHDKEPRPCPAKAKKVNQELGILIHLMKRAGCWTPQLEEAYQGLEDDEEEMPRALSPEEQRHWLDCARLRPEWNTVYLYSMLCFGTCMSTNEIRGLRIGDINIFQRIVNIPKKIAKSKARIRTIPLEGADVLWATEHLIERARQLGATEMDHYLFPSRVNVHEYDPTQPMSVSGIKRAWNEVRAHSGLKWFRQYDCRHTAITRLAESGVPTDVIMAMAGHVTERMRRHYTHISQQSQRRWLEFARMPPMPSTRVVPMFGRRTGG